MKENKIFRILAIVLCLAFLASCGQSNEKGTTNNSSESLAIPSGDSEGNKDSNDDSSESANIDWPKETIEIICGMSPGGDSDFNTRVIAKYLQKKLGSSVIVTNITGAGGTIATDDFVSNSKPDGYRLYLNHAPLHTAKAFGLTDYGWSDMDPVCCVGEGTGEFITVRSDFPANDVKELIEETKKKPGEYRFGINPGATSNYMCVVLEKNGAKFNVVASGSASDRVVALKGNHLDIILAGYPNIKDYVDSGEFKVLASCASERYPTVDQFSTVMEQGIDGKFDPYYVLYAPKGTDPDVIKKISLTCKDIIENDKDYQKEIKDEFLQVPIYFDTEETIELLKKQEKIYTDMSDDLRNSYKKQSN